MDIERGTNNRGVGHHRQIFVLHYAPGGVFIAFWIIYTQSEHDLLFKALTML